MQIEDIVKEKLNEIDLNDIVADEVRQIISEPLRRKIAEYTAERIKALIDVEIEIAINKPVKTDDGWGKRKEYANFEELYKQIFAEKINGAYEIKRTIENTVKARVDELFKANAQVVIKKIADELTKTA